MQEVSRAALPPVKPSDTVMGEVERLNARLESLHAELAGLRERVSGSPLPATAGEDRAETAFALGGFVGTVGQGLERAHRLLGYVSETVNGIAQTI